MSIDPPPAVPQRSLSVWHAAALATGMVIGAGIFRSSASVAAAVPDTVTFFAVWAAGGLFALAGALVYAELAGAFPSTGGDYGFLRAAYGRGVGFLFAWSRFAVVFTGSTALLGFVLSDYVAKLIPVGAVGQAGIAAGAITALTAMNLLGVRVGASVQIVLVILDAIALVLLGIAGLIAGAPVHEIAHAAAAPAGGIAVAAVFVMLAYGGWNDAATLSTELRGGPRAMVKALAGGMAAVTGLYLLTNWGYWHGLGLDGLAASKAPAADLMGRAFGPAGETLIVTLVALTTIAVMNALIIVGGRTLYAAAGDFPALRHFGRWDARRGTPRPAMLAQSAFAILLVVYGAWTRTGFETMVNFLAPVFWLFQALSGASILVLRRTRADVARPFRLPLYPWPALIFLASSSYVFVSTIAYVGARGALISASVLAVGAVVLVAIWPGSKRW